LNQDHTNDITWSPGNGALTFLWWCYHTFSERWGRRGIPWSPNPSSFNPVGLAAYWKYRL